MPIASAKLFCLVFSCLRLLAILFPVSTLFIYEIEQLENKLGNLVETHEDAEHIQIGAFTLTAEDAKAYLYSFSTKRRVYNWKDLNVTVWI